MDLQAKVVAEMEGGKGAGQLRNGVWGSPPNLDVASETVEDGVEVRARGGTEDWQNLGSSSPSGSWWLLPSLSQVRAELVADEVVGQSLRGLGNKPMAKYWWEPLPLKKDVAEPVCEFLQCPIGIEMTIFLNEVRKFFEAYQEIVIEWNKGINHSK